MQFIDLKAQQARIKDKIDQRIQDVLAHGRYIMGPEVAEVEQKLAEFAGVKHVVSCGNGTDALSLAQMALGIKPGDEVITTPFTFVSTAETIAMLGAIPVFVDVDPKTFNLDANLLEEKITDKTKAIMPVSLYGQCADMTAINAIADKYGIPVIEDAAQSFGATQHGKQSCGLSTIATTSFFPAKPLGCYGDGGAVVTNDDALAEKVRWLRNHGQRERDDVQLIGMNGRFDTMQAAILLEKLAIYEDELRLRHEVATKYNTALKGIIDTPYIMPGNTSTYAEYTCTADNRDEIMARLKAAGIPTVVYYPVPSHLSPAYKYLGYKEGDLPQAEKAAKTVFSLPMHPYLTDVDIQRIAAACKSV
jgi:UDP-2-acetamido-2-deoxy-ribo-hexuluronate aminotransferase